MYSTIIFDLDGTLLNTLGDIANAGNYTLRRLSAPQYPPEAFRLMVGNGIKKLVFRMLPEERRDTETLHLAHTLFTEYYQLHALDETHPYPGILSLLDSLHAAGTQLAVLSNKNDNMVKHIVSHTLGARFDAVWGLRPEHPAKPHPQSLLALLRDLDASPTTSLYCGDSDVDILTAKHAGLASCGVLWGFRSKIELEAASATYIANSTSDIAKLVL